MHRFYVDTSSISAGRVTLPPEISLQVTKVLRLRPREHIAVFDGSGQEWRVQLDQLTPHEVSGVVMEIGRPESEPALAITLCQAVLKADRFEFVLQRCTEAGVARFQPFVSERCVAEMPRGARSERWQRIVRESAEQSGRVRVPKILPPVRLADLPGQPGLGPAIVLWEEETVLPMREALDRTAGAAASGSIALIIGPEGGLEASEVALLAAAGIPAASLGRRVFRAETAALAATVATLYHHRCLG